MEERTHTIFCTTTFMEQSDKVADTIVHFYMPQHMFPRDIVIYPGERIKLTTVTAEGEEHEQQCRLFRLHQWWTFEKDGIMFVNFMMTRIFEVNFSQPPS